MKIAILSCFYPFRGGIAQFNANLLKELGDEHDLRAFNFTRQYPSFLFPGKTQKVTPQDNAVSVESTALLDTANPFTWGKTARVIADWEPDILVVRYWMSYFAPSLGHVSRKVKKYCKGKCKVVAIIDNVIPHEPHFFDKPLTKYFLGGVDGSITLCNEVGQDLLNIRPDAKYTVIPHPVYTHFGEKLPKQEAQQILGLTPGKKNILFFGLIREYKGLDILIKAFSGLDDSYQLIIAGEPYGSFDKYQKLIDENPNAERIHCFLNYISDNEVKNYFSAADLTVLPYRSATQSGISAICNHFEQPMVVTDVGGLKETIADKGIVCKDCEPETIQAAIKEYFCNTELREKCIEAIKQENDRLSWNRFCKDFISFLKSL